MKGFSLVEVLVALTVFAVLAAAGSAILWQTATGQQAITAQADEVMTLQRLHSVLRADLAQMTSRMSRDERGDLAAATCGAADAAAPLLFLVRRGHDNPDAAARSTLQVVRYQLSGGALERQTRAMLDGAPWQQGDVLLDGVSTITLSCLVGQVWTDHHQVVNDRALPRAVRLSIARDTAPSIDLLLLGPALS